MDLLISALELNDGELFRQYLSQTPEPDIKDLVRQGLIFGATNVIRNLYSFTPPISIPLAFELRDNFSSLGRDIEDTNQRFQEGIDINDFIEAETSNRLSGEENRTTLAEVALSPDMEEMFEELELSDYLAALEPFENGQLRVFEDYLLELISRTNVIRKDILFMAVDTLLRQQSPDIPEELSLDIGKFLQRYATWMYSNLGRIGDPSFYEEIAYLLIESGYDSDLTDLIAWLLENKRQEMEILLRYFPRSDI